jgi:glutamate/tyrosine decarboxylase-like PLP-dependent enzyme
VDPLSDILELRSKYGFRIHVDAAYGGYFILADNLAPETKAVFDCLSEVDSIVVDPHKHGLQPYGCGCILFKDPRVGALYKHESPYTYFSSSELHLGEISLECSRAGASAVALWATQRLLPLVRGGVFSQDLSKARKAALIVFDRLSRDSRFMIPFCPELDIVVWAPKSMSATASSKMSRRVYEEAATRNLHLALAELPTKFFASIWQDDVVWDRDFITCLRSCLMKPEHLEWIDSIYGIMSSSMDAVK